MFAALLLTMAALLACYCLRHRMRAAQLSKYDDDAESPRTGSVIMNKQALCHDGASQEIYTPDTTPCGTLPLRCHTLRAHTCIHTARLSVSRSMHKVTMLLGCLPKTWRTLVRTGVQA